MPEIQIWKSDLWWKSNSFMSEMSRALVESIEFQICVWFVL